jgi:hypothetical protein
MANLSEFANFFIKKKKEDFENDLQENKTLSEEDSKLYLNLIKCSLRNENDPIKNTALLFLVDQINKKTLEFSQLTQKIALQTFSNGKFNDEDLTSDDAYLQIIQIMNSMKDLIPKAVDGERNRQTNILGKRIHENKLEKFDEESDNSIEDSIPKAIDGKRNRITNMLGKSIRENELENNDEEPEELFKYPEEYLSIDLLNNFYEEPIDGPLSHSK